MDVDGDEDGGVTTLKAKPSVNTQICSMLMAGSGLAITTIYSQVLAAIGTGPVGMAAYTVLMTLGGGYLGAFC
ncbi:hypothetical protein JOE23_001829 [Amphibacillus cookii]|nr:hypothetical protein [Amphibacillus cookii]